MKIYCFGTNSVQLIDGAKMKEKKDQSNNEIDERKGLTGKDFYFLIKPKSATDWVPGGFTIEDEYYYRVMKPNSVSVKTLNRNKWDIIFDSKINEHVWTFDYRGYKWFYSLTMAGIEMVFRKDVPYTIALMIAEEVKENITKHTGIVAEIETIA